MLRSFSTLLIPLLLLNGCTAAPFNTSIAISNTSMPLKGISTITPRQDEERMWPFHSVKTTSYFDRLEQHIRATHMSLWLKTINYDDKLMSRWVTEGLTFDQVLKNLGMTNENLFRDVKTIMLVKYIDKWNLQHTDAQVNLLDALTSAFGTEKSLLMGIADTLQWENAIQYEKSFANWIAHEVINKWITDKISPDQVLKKLQFDHDNFLYFNGYQMILKDYQTTIKMNSDLAFQQLDTLEQQYSKACLNWLLQHTHYQTQMSRWLDHNLDAYNVAKFLKLSNSNTNLLLDDRTITLVSYIHRFNEKHSTKVNLIDVLTKTFGGEDQLLKGLADVLNLEAPIPFGKELEGLEHQQTFQTALAGLVKSQVVTKWINDDISRPQVLKKLQLDESVDKILLFKGYRTILTDYVTRSKIKLIDPLIKHYGDDVVVETLGPWTLGHLTHRFQRAQSLGIKVNSWPFRKAEGIAHELFQQQLDGYFAQKKTVDDVFDLLKLSKKGKPDLNPFKLEMLQDYIWLVDSKHILKHERPLTQVLKSRFHDHEMLKKAFSETLENSDETLKSMIELWMKRLEE